MSIIPSLRGAVKQRSVQPADPVIADWLNVSSMTASGESVTAETARKVGAVFACVRLISETIAALPIFTYRRTNGGGKIKDFQHPLYNLLYSRPNKWQTAFEFKQMMVTHMLLRRYGFAEIVLGRNGDVEQLIPLHPDRVQITSDSRGLPAYIYTPPLGERRAYMFEEMLCFDAGMNIIEGAGETIGLAIAVEKHAGRFFQNDATPGGLITRTSHFKDEETKRNFVKQWQAAQTGKNKYKTAMLEPGMDYKSIGLTNKDSQMLELRKFQVTDIARAFRVPPHLIADMEAATFSNIEQQSIEFVVHTIMPWIVRMENVIERDLYTTDMRSTHFSAFLPNALLRGDVKARYEAYAIGRQNGFLSANDIRRLEDMNPFDGGDVYLVPLNMVPTSQLNAMGNRDIALAAAARMARVEVNAVNRAKEKHDDPAILEKWAQDFYRSHALKTAEALAMSGEALSEYYETTALQEFFKNGINEQSRITDLMKMKSEVEHEV